MLHKTKGIVLNYLKHKESSIIVKIYTQLFGLQTYIINGVRSNNKKNPQKISFFQPLTLLDLVVYYHSEGNRINRVKEIKCYYPFQHIPLDFQKISIAFFLAEILSKTLKEEEPNELLFQFLENALIYFDDLHQDFEHFHLHFLLKFTFFLGFTPSNADEIFEQISTYKKILLSEEQAQEVKEKINFFIHQDFDQKTTLNPWLRKCVIDYVLDFYHLHIASFFPIKSLTILREMNR